MIRTHSLTFHVVRCDHCQNQNRTVADGWGSADDARHDAIAHGWVVDETRDLCPACSLMEPS